MAKKKDCKQMQVCFLGNTFENVHFSKKNSFFDIK